MRRSIPRVSLVLFILRLFVAGLPAVAQRQIAALHPPQGLVWQRTTPSAATPDGPVLYQLIFRLPDAAGDVNGKFPNLTVVGLAGVPLSPVAPASGQVLTFNGSHWEPATSPAAGLQSLSVNAPLSSSGGANPTLSLSLQASDVPDLSATYVNLVDPQIIMADKTFMGNVMFFNTIQGNAQSAGFASAADTANTATTANNALKLGGNLASAYSTTAQSNALYLQLSGGNLSGNLNGTNASFSGSGSFGDILNTAGGLQLPPLGTATTGSGFNSNFQDLIGSAFNTVSGFAVNQRFRWQVEAVNNNTPQASGTLNLLFGNLPVSETGLSIDSHGNITFAPGQSFVGTNVDSGAATSGQVLTATGNGHALWTNAPSISAGQVVKSLNGVQDAVTLASGLGLTLTTNGQTITVANVGQNDAASGLFATAAAGRNNTASGALSAAIAGDGNSATGQDAVVVGGCCNVASGQESMVGSGDSNTAGGFLSFVAGGFFNKLSGTGSFAAGQCTTDAGHLGVFLWGDFVSGCDTSINQLKATGNNQFLARATGGVTFFTNSAFTTGVSVAAGGGSWSSVSDRNVKDNFAAIDNRQLLARVLALPITTWNYKSQAASIRHIGPMAQDFFAAFNVGEDDRHITTIDEGGVALAAIQGLNEKLQDELRQKDSQIAALATQLAAQAEQMRQVQAELMNLRKAVEVQLAKK